MKPKDFDGRIWETLPQRILNSKIGVRQNIIRSQPGKLRFDLLQNDWKIYFFPTSHSSIDDRHIYLIFNRVKDHQMDIKGFKGDWSVHMQLLNFNGHLLNRLLMVENCDWGAVFLIDCDLIEHFFHGTVLALKETGHSLNICWSISLVVFLSGLPHRGFCFREGIKYAGFGVVWHFFEVDRCQVCVFWFSSLRKDFSELFYQSCVCFLRVIMLVSLFHFAIDKN